MNVAKVTLSVTMRMSQEQESFLEETRDYLIRAKEAAGGNPEIDLVHCYAPTDVEEVEVVRRLAALALEIPCNMRIHLQDREVDIRPMDYVLGQLRKPILEKQAARRAKNRPKPPEPSKAVAYSPDIAIRKERLNVVSEDARARDDGEDVER